MKTHSVVVSLTLALSRSLTHVARAALMIRLPTWRKRFSLPRTTLALSAFWTLRMLHRKSSQTKRLCSPTLPSSSRGARKIGRVVFCFAAVFVLWLTPRRSHPALPTTCAVQAWRAPFARPLTLRGATTLGLKSTPPRRLSCKPGLPKRRRSSRAVTTATRLTLSRRPWWRSTST